MKVKFEHVFWMCGRQVVDDDCQGRPGVREVVADVTADCVPYSPARTYGDPGDCYPSEGGYADDFVVLTPEGRDITEQALRADEDGLQDAASEAGAAIDARAEAGREDAMEEKRWALRARRAGLNG